MPWSRKQITYNYTSQIRSLFNGTQSSFFLLKPFTLFLKLCFNSNLDSSDNVVADHHGEGYQHQRVNRVSVWQRAAPQAPLTGTIFEMKAHVYNDLLPVRYLFNLVLGKRPYFVAKSVHGVLALGLLVRRRQIMSGGSCRGLLMRAASKMRRVENSHDEW